MLTRLAHVCLDVPNLSKTLAFYGKTLKLKRQFNFIRKGKIIGAYFKVSPGNYIEIFGRRPLPSARPPVGIVHFCLETKNIERVMAWLKKKRVKHTAQKMGCDGSWQIWLKDPAGNNIEIHQYTRRSRQRTGRDAIATW